MQKSNDRIPRAEWRLAEKMARQGLKNQKFRALDPATKRVAIAKDVLKWLATGKLKAQSGFYLLAPTEVVDVVNGYKCEACALGSLFACAVERGDAGGTVVESPSLRNYYGSIGMRADTFEGVKLYSKLEGIFDKVQLAMIEGAFEPEHSFPRDSREAGGSKRQWDEVQGTYWVDSPEIAWAMAWHKTAPKDPSDRMKAIMENIIANNGTFVP